MKGLLYLFLKYGGFITFIFLEAICFLIIINANEDQREVGEATLEEWTGIMQERYDNAVEYVQLSSVADSLSKENARLYEIIVNSNLDPDVFGQKTIEDEEGNALYQLNAAHVVYNSVTKFRNYIRLNKGAKDGVKEDQGIISDQGVIGIVRGVSENYSVAMSFLHPQTRVSVAIKGSGSFGSLSWQGSDPTKALLQGIPKNNAIQVGDTIQTSGYSAKFPSGIMIGRIANFELEQGSNSYDIEVDLSEDFTSLEYVYVVENINSQEQLELQEKVESE